MALPLLTLGAGLLNTGLNIASGISMRKDIDKRVKSLRQARHNAMGRFSEAIKGQERQSNVYGSNIATAHIVADSADKASGAADSFLRMKSMYDQNISGLRQQKEQTDMQYQHSIDQVRASKPSSGQIIAQAGTDLFNTGMQAYGAYQAGEAQKEASHYAGQVAGGMGLEPYKGSSFRESLSGMGDLFNFGKNKFSVGKTDLSGVEIKDFNPFSNRERDNSWQNAFHNKNLNSSRQMMKHVDETQDPFLNPRRRRF